jgi:hypothetical protein
MSNDTPILLPTDIRPAWLNVIRSLQSHARSQSGLAMLTITVFVNADALPIAWTTPRRVCFEPKANAGQFLELLQSIR